MNPNALSINKLSTGKGIENSDSIHKVQQLETRTITALKINKEYQALVAPLAKDEYEKLKEDIQKYGQHEPIKVNRQGEILDGFSRNRVCIESGIQPKFEVKIFENKLLEKRYVIAANRYRRHLNTFQRVELELALESIDKEIAKQNIIANLPTNTNSQNSVNRLGRQGVNQSTAKRAKTSYETVRQVKAILEKGSEEIKEKLRADKIKINKVYNTIKREETRKQLREEAANTPFPTITGIQLLHGNFIEKSKEITENSIDLIFTDPQYELESLYFYGELAKVAERVLKSGGRLIMYIGGYSIPEVIDRIRNNSSLRWNCDLIVEHTGPTKPMHGQRVFIRHKTLFYFIKGDKNNSPYYIDTLIHSKPVDKIAHDWEQSPVEAEQCISRLTLENQTVFDPMMGSGTTGKEAVKLNRKFIGIEIDEGHFKIAQFRIGKVISNRASFCNNIITSSLQAANDDYDSNDVTKSDTS